jgi:hypothetical protein
MINYRATVVQRVFVFLAGSVLGVAIAGGAIVANGGAVTPAGFKQGLFFVVVATLTGVFVRPDHGITATPESVVINGSRKRVMGWRSIADIAVANRYGFRTVVIKGFEGQYFRLLAPYSFLDREFDDKVKTIREYWQSQCNKALS